jgi:hypothetical protein
MTRPCVFALGLTLGALITPLAQHATARICGTHYLAVTIKETP